jgi:hypothetical protein
MNKGYYLQKLIDEFDNWYRNDIHSKNRDHYKNIISKQNIENFSDREFIHFFYEFVSDGGKVQSGGDRTKNKFKDTIEKALDSFRSFVIEPFNINFDLYDWFKRIDNYPGFGIGIATIYLNRIDYDSYPIMNNKTLKALNKLGYALSSTKNYANYERVKKIQRELISEFPVLENLYKSDALTHFIISVYEGEIYLSQDEKEQQELIEFYKKTKTKKELLEDLKNLQPTDSEEIFVNQKTYKRDNLTIAKIKILRDFKCQICGTAIIKRDGSKYIEAAHIKAKHQKGRETLDNIILLCPNHHKEFDLGDRLIKFHNSNFIDFMLNGRRHKINLTTEE